MSDEQGVPMATRHDPAVTGDLGSPFAAGAISAGMKGSQGQFERVSLDVAVGSVGGQPALRGMFPHPIPPNKGDRW